MRDTNGEHSISPADLTARLIPIFLQNPQTTESCSSAYSACAASLALPPGRCCICDVSSKQRSSSSERRDRFEGTYLNCGCELALSNDWISVFCKISWSTLHHIYFHFHKTLKVLQQILESLKFWHDEHNKERKLKIFKLTKVELHKILKMKELGCIEECQITLTFLNRLASTTSFANSIKLSRPLIKTCV